jgi:hypothetical protein
MNATARTEGEAPEIVELREKLAARGEEPPLGDIALWYAGVVERIATGELVDPVEYARVALRVRP